MALTFNYAILTAIPDPRRGERVNVGVIVFLADRVDVRFTELAKLSALRGGNWEQYTADVRARAIQNYSKGEAPQLFVERFSILEGVIHCSDLGWFSVERVEEYEERVRQVLASLVLRPKLETRAKSTRINAEIAKTFRQAKVLAPEGQGVEAGKVVRDLTVSAEDDLRADFGLKNGRFHVTATLDLRRPNADKGQAAIKAITLDRASRTFKDVRTIGVYAAPHGAGEFRAHIHMLREYAHDTYDWTDPQERAAYIRSIYNALNSPGNFGLKSK